MGRLTDLLSANNVVENKIKTNKITTKLDTNTITESETSTIGTLTVDEYQMVKDSIKQIDMNNKTRREIIIGMYGSITNPKTNKRFVIPMLSYQDEDYIYQYAKYMKTLINRPEEFTKVMEME